MKQNNAYVSRNILFDAGGGSKPVVRAMLANVHLFGGIGFFIIAIFLVIAHSSNIVLEILVTLIGIFFIRYYILSVARIIVNDDSMVIMLSLHEVTLTRGMIKYIELNRLHISNMLKIKIHGKEKEEKWIYHLFWYKGNEDIEILKSSWLKESCMLNGKPLSPDGSYH